MKLNSQTFVTCFELILTMYYNVQCTVYSSCIVDVSFTIQATYHTTLNCLLNISLCFRQLQWREQKRPKTSSSTRLMHSTRKKKQPETIHISIIRYENLFLSFFLLNRIFHRIAYVTSVMAYEFFIFVPKSTNHHVWMMLLLLFVCNL